MRTESLDHSGNSYRAKDSFSESAGGLTQDKVPKIGRYRGIKRVGEGGMAEVYLAYDDVLGRDVALKVLQRRLVDEQLVERFRREARSAASLSHPNIVSVYDWGEAEDGSYYLVMEYVPGGTLKELIDREGPLPTERILDIAMQTARALEMAHSRGLVHRDIKPQNILIDGFGCVKVTDFGIARAAATPAMTEPGCIVGTAHYISPEQATGEPVGPASDLYSLGAVVYEMATGQVPYDAEDPVAILMKHLEGALKPPKELDAGVPEQLNDITVKLLDRDPEKRYTETTNFIEDLEKARLWGSRSQNTAAQNTVVSQGPEKGRRSRFSLMAGFIGLLLAVAVVGLALWLSSAFSWAEEFSFLSFGPERVEVPDVTGEPREAAVEGLESEGFGVRTRDLESPVEDEGIVVRQVPPDGELKVDETVEIWVGQGPPPEKDEELLRREVREYYSAVDRGGWGYTYAHLDPKTQALFTEEDWARRNQFLADNNPGELSSIRVDITINADEPANVTVYRTFKGDLHNVRDTLFVYEEGMWKHRLVSEELDPFLVNLSYEEFVSYYGGA
ncbi:hypothetical protein BH24ACT22_BH24ACT22_05010 [soil metagenome]